MTTAPFFYLHYTPLSRVVKAENFFLRCTGSSQKPLYSFIAVNGPRKCVGCTK